MHRVSFGWIYAIGTLLSSSGNYFLDGGEHFRVNVLLSLLSGGLCQLHEVDGLGVLGWPVVECLGREETRALGKVVGIPEDAR